MYISSLSSQKVRHPQLAGIDKIEMTYPPGSFTVADHKTLDYQLSRTAGNTVPPLLVDGNGVEVVASKLKHNAPNGISFDIDHRGMMVRVNPSKVLTGHPFNLLTDPSELMDVGSQVSTMANAVGIDLDPNAGRLYRVDLTKQNTMDEPVSVYGQALRYARASRMNRKEYPDGHLFHNSNRELCFYDKQKDLTRKRRKVPPLKIIVPDNFLRAEGRLMGSDTVAKDLGVTTFRDLLNSDPLALTTVYGRNMDRLLFHPLNAGHQMSISFVDDMEYINDLATRYGTRAWSVYERLHGTLSMIEVHGGMENIERFLWAMHNAGGVSRATVYRRLTQLKMDLVERATLDHIRNERSVATRLEEIRHTFTSIPNAA